MQPASSPYKARRLIGANRPDARVSDLHVFTNNGNLVLAMATFPNIPVTASGSYKFAADLTFTFKIDNNSAVSFADSARNTEFGGTIVNPDAMDADIELEVEFDDMGNPSLTTSGLTAEQEDMVNLFTGLRDDPFIRGPQIGRNVAAIVVEIPQSFVLGNQSTILVWATARAGQLKVSGVKQHELGARALRSQCPQPQCNALDGPDLNLRNETSPHRYSTDLGNNIPDVVIYDTSRPALFPNGRLLTDDVVDIVATFPSGQNILGNDAPFPSTNDKPFLAVFPYYAAPH